MAKRVRIEGLLQDYPSGGKDGRARNWSVGFSLAPWRENGGPWDKRLLLVDVTMNDRELAAAVARWREGSAVRIEATPPAPTKARGPKIRMLARGVLPVRRFAGKIPDLDAEAAPPSTLDHPKLGRLRHDDLMGYCAWRKAGTDRYEISIQPRDPTNAEKLARDVGVFAAVVVGVERKLGAWKTAAAKKVLPVYDKHWREDGPRVSATAMAKRFALQSIVVQPTGRGSLLFGAGRLFADHGVEVSIGKNGQLTGVDLA